MFKKIMLQSVCVAIFLSLYSIIAMDGSNTHEISDEAIWQGIYRRCVLEESKPGQSILVQGLKDFAAGKIPELQISNLEVRDRADRNFIIKVVLYGFSQVASPSDSIDKK